MKAAASLACVLFLACGGSSSESTTTPTETPTTDTAETATAGADLIAASVANADRPEADTARDEHRKPAETMRFMGVEPGMTVVDIMAGGGYYSELLVGAVGPEGTVYVHNNKGVLEMFAEKPITDRLARMANDKAVRHDKELDALELPAGEIDIAFMGLFYHDAFWLGVDRAKMNADVLAGLKPGGIYVITDHHAEAGSKDRDVKEKHRGDAELIKAEILAAGFEFVEESDILSHPEDPRSASVFEEGLRGKTDRFVYKFRKPN